MMKRLYQGWIKWTDKKDEPKQTLADRMRQIALHEIIQIAEKGEESVGVLGGWGMCAAEEDLRDIRSRLLEAQDPAVIASYLRVFSNRPVPEFNERLLTLLDHEDRKIRSRAFLAISKNSHQSIRKFALDHLRKGATEFGFLKLFIRNSIPGDDALLLEVLQIPDDVHERHWLLRDLRKVLEQNSELKVGELGTIIYGLTPCGSCRRDTCKLLVGRKAAPEWLLEECRYDALEGTRN
jgi:hypothetical protein